MTQGVSGPGLAPRPGSLTNSDDPNQAARALELPKLTLGALAPAVHHDWGSGRPYGANTLIGPQYAQLVHRLWMGWTSVGRSLLGPGAGTALEAERPPSGSGGVATSCPGHG
jgi:hypothetical protein